MRGSVVVTESPSPLKFVPQGLERARPLQAVCRLFAVTGKMSVEAASEPKKQRRIVEDDDDNMEDAEAPQQPSIKENRAQPLPGQQEEFSPELLRM